MAKYLGPYDSVKPDGENGKEYHPGDNIPGAASRITYLRDREHLRFEDDPIPDPVVPISPVPNAAINADQGARLSNTVDPDKK